MDDWITPEIAKVIFNIFDLISKNRFDVLESRGVFELSSGVEIKRAVLEYLCGDVSDEREISRVGVPDMMYLKKNATLYEIDPEQPTLDGKRVQVAFLVDGVESDLTLTLRVRKSDKGESVRIYDAHVL